MSVWTLYLAILALALFVACVFVVGLFYLQLRSPHDLNSTHDDLMSVVEHIVSANFTQLQVFLEELKAHDVPFKNELIDTKIGNVEQLRAISTYLIKAQQQSFVQEHVLQNLRDELRSVDLIRTQQPVPKPFT